METQPAPRRRIVAGEGWKDNQLVPESETADACGDVRAERSLNIFLLLVGVTQVGLRWSRDRAAHRAQAVEAAPVGMDQLLPFGLMTEHVTHDHGIGTGAG